MTLLRHRHRRTSRRKAWELQNGSPAFDPRDSGKVSAWLRFSQATVTGSGYSSVPDVLNSNPAVQGTDGRRPINGTAANGLPVATFSDDLLEWPFANGSNNQTPRWGIAMWVRATSDGTPRRIWCAHTANGSASASRIEINHDTNGSRGIHADVYRTNTDGMRAAGITNFTGAWAFLTVEYDGGQATNATKCLITLGGSALSCTFTTLNTDVALPAALPQPTGNILIGARTTVPAFQFVGDIGPNIFILNAQLTAAERTALMGFEAPT